MPSIFDTYFSRFSVFPQVLTEPVNRDLGIIVTIPCYNEPEITKTLDSLRNCQKPTCSVEIIIVVNHSVTSPINYKSANYKTTTIIQEYQKNYSANKFKVLYFSAFDIPKKQAGVGYARKVAMDEAIHRFSSIQNENGIIVSCDADTVVDSNYFIEIETYYRNNPKITATNIYFEHPLQGELPKNQYQAIALYELYLRYYVEELRHIGFPYAFHTIGSCFSVRAKTYCRQGGMNKHQAGEDFYFLQKLFSAESFGEINSTCVHPSSRTSDRVPFGTGTVLTKLVDNPNNYVTFTHENFLVLQQLFTLLPQLERAENIDDLFLQLHPSLQEFFSRQEFCDKISEIQKYTTNNDAFRKRFFNWFNGFQIFKYLNFSSQTFFPKKTLLQEANLLIHQNYSDCFTLLADYRRKQKGDPK